MATGESAQAKLHLGEEYVDEGFRRAHVVSIAEELLIHAVDRISAIAPAVSAHFNVHVTECEEPHFVLYRKGDFIVPHIDVTNGDAAGPFRRRKIAVIVFLNDGSPVDPSANTSATTDQPFHGGLLSFYPSGRRSEGDPRFSLVAETGLLVAFRPGIRHEVSPVIAGERYTIVTWLLSPRDG